MKLWKKWLSGVNENQEERQRNGSFGRGKSLIICRGESMANEGLEWSSRERIQWDSVGPLQEENRNDKDNKILQV